MIFMMLRRNFRLNHMDDRKTITSQFNDCMAPHDLRPRPWLPPHRRTTRTQVRAGAQLARYFTLARGVADEVAHADDCGCGQPHGTTRYALEMTKWFDTNYHYLVPEFSAQTQFSLSSKRLFKEVDEALRLGHRVKPVLLGPLSFLGLGKEKVEGFDRLSLLPALLHAYVDILERLGAAGIQWVQIDEPILGLDLPGAWRDS